ncbi:hypothetical protein OJ912_11105, partial [Streptococcus anginosus]|uniref:hypothetical protein n=1 Tax=Streptococcus anginosus TaxID=1328 RepID=UPI0021F8804F
YDADILINDILDTSIDYKQMLKQRDLRIINFEDIGPGADLADAVINDLYAPQKKGSQYYWGSPYYIIRDEFLINYPSDFHEEVKNIFV